MSRISASIASSATSDIGALYHTVFSQGGNVPNMFRVMTQRPSARAQLEANQRVHDRPETAESPALPRIWINLAARGGAHEPPSIRHWCNTISSMVRIQAEYQGDLHCTSVHTPSKTELATDAPVDNQGRGESFSPTDLMATSLGTCMLTTMGIVARPLDVDLTGATATVDKEMSSTPPRKVCRLTVSIRIPRTTSAENRQRLENAAHTCPVKKSIHPDIETPIDFVWG